MLRILLASLLLTGCTDGVARPLQSSQPPNVVISEVMANPSAVPDERGEWFEVHNRGGAPAELRGWRIASGNDSPVAITRSVVVPAGGRVVLARNGSAAENGGVAAAFEYGAGISLANGSDWLALRDSSGATVDSVAWTSAPSGASRVRDGGEWRTSTAVFGAVDRGTPGSATGVRAADAPAAPRPAPAPSPRPSPAPGQRSELVVRVLDVGQGDATLITNGTSRVLIDGGPDRNRMGELLDSLDLNGSTIDVVILSHAHFDHHGGLRELFRRSRGIRVRYFFENGDPSTNGALRQLRDSVIARVRRKELIFRDTDDPCSDGRPVCTINLNGGARLHVMRPLPGRHDANDRSTPVKLLGPDSASFSMWLAGDAEHAAIRWFDTGAEYDVSPGMKVTVLKGGHHGSCNGVSARYLRLTDPEWVALSLAARNDYGHAHTQASALYSRMGKPWYRTDQNGTITFRSPGTPGGGYTASVQRGAPNARGPSDRASTQPGCNPLP